MNKENIILEFMKDENYTPMKAKEIAGIFMVPKNKYNNFKSILDKLEKEYKIQMAAQLLLTTQLSISEIAGKIGYSNPNKFSSAFRSIIGMSPREYRNAKK